MGQREGVGGRFHRVVDASRPIEESGQAVMVLLASEVLDAVLYPALRGAGRIRARNTHLHSSGA